MFRKLFGLAPQQLSDSSYMPSKLSLKLATNKVSNYTEESYPDAVKGKGYKILVVCTEHTNLKMQNGTEFFTGNHPEELLVPMLHLQNAGFDFDIYTPTGKPAQLEMWAFPKEDKKVMAIFEDYKSQFHNPKSVAELVEKNFETDQNYAAIFIPGGHGVLIGIPEDRNVGNLIRWFFDKDLFVLTLCHGPSSFVATTIGNEKDPFIFDGYKIVVFPDSQDKQNPSFGYTPGQLTWNVGEKLQSLGVTIMNTKADDSIMADRKLLTGASPKAANKVGILYATTLLKHLNKK